MHVGLSFNLLRKKLASQGIIEIIALLHTKMYRLSLSSGLIVLLERKLSSLRYCCVPASECVHDVMMVWLDF